MRNLTLLLAVLCALLIASPGPAAAGGVRFGLTNAQLTNLGDGIEYGLPVIALGVTAVHKDWTGAAQLAVLTASTVGISFAIRSLVKKTSPDGSDHRSFPSIEASFGSPAEHYLWTRYGWEYGVPAFFLEHAGNYFLDRAKKHKIQDGLAVTAFSTVLDHFMVTRYHRPIEVGTYGADDGTPMVGIRMALD